MINIPFIKPELPEYKNFEDDFKSIINSGMLSKGEYLKIYETDIKQYLNAENVVAVSSGTMGLILTLEAFGIGPGDEVIVPSFTFCATAHAIIKVGATPVFADCREDTFNIDIKKIKHLITKNTKAILAVHIFGVPADVYELEKIGKEYDIKIIYDSAHAMGSKFDDIHIGNFGDAEIFSTSPTKTLVTGEGGLVVTKHKKIAEFLIIAREYGNSGDYDCKFIGVNGRLSENAALIGLKSLSILDETLNKRVNVAKKYIRLLSKIPGVTLQYIPDNITSTYKDISILINKDIFGCSRDELVEYLTKQGIPTRNYFSPCLHKMSCYAQYHHLVLPITEKISNTIISLPMFASIKDEQMEYIVDTIEKARKDY